MTISETLSLLHYENSTCALVFSKDNLFIGLLDTPDLIRYIIHPRSLLNVSIRRVIHQCIVVNSESTINDVVTYMRDGFRYIVHFDFLNYTVVSQMGVMEEILKDENNCDALEKDANFYSLGLNQKIITCPLENNAHYAFEKMAAYCITSLPIIDKECKIVGVISATDVLYARYNKEFLELNVVIFVEKSRKDARNIRPVNTIVTCNYNDSIYNILRIMINENVHHLYILDDKTVPIGVVSFIDILKVL